MVALVYVVLTAATAPLTNLSLMQHGSQSTADLSFQHCADIYGGTMRVYCRTATSH